MNILLGDRDSYYSQLNDGTYYLLKHYNAKSKAVACGPNAVLCAMEIAGWMQEKYKKLWPDYVQKTDYYMMMLYNPHNDNTLEKLRAAALEFPHQEVPQYLPLINLLYNKKVVNFAWGCNIGIIESHLKNSQPVVICGKFPGVGGHYVTIRGIKDDCFIYSDSYNIDKSKDYFSKEMTFEFFEKYINKSFRLFIAKEGII